MAEVNDAFAQHDAPGGAIGEPGALRGNLGRKAKHVCGAGAVDLQMRARFPGKRLCHIVWRRRQGAEFRMLLRKIIKPAGKPTQLPGLRQTRKGLVDSGPGGDVEEITRCEHTAASVCTDTLHDPIGNRG